MLQKAVRFSGCCPVPQYRMFTEAPNTVLKSKLFLNSWIYFKRVQTFVLFAQRNPCPRSHRPASLFSLATVLLADGRRMCPSTSLGAAALRHTRSEPDGEAASEARRGGTAFRHPNGDAYLAYCNRADKYQRGWKWEGGSGF